MPTISSEESKRLDALIDKIVANNADESEVLEAAGIAKKYTRNLRVI